MLLFPLRGPAKMLMVMKLTSILLIVTCFSAFASVNSQNVKLSVKNVQLQEVFKEIYQQTGFQFFYKDALLNSASNVSLKVNDASLDEVLKLCLKDLNVDYKIVNKTIILTSKEVKILPSSILEVQQTAYIIKGKVTNARGEPLPGVSIMIKGTTKGVVSNTDGSFQITVDPKDKILVFTSIGMVAQEITINEKKTINVVLQEKVTSLNDVVITGIVNRNANSFTGAATTITKEDLLKVSNKNLVESLKVLEPSLMIFDNLDFGSDPNQMPEMLLRGTSSFQQDQSVDLRSSYANSPNQPLFILDGFEISLTKVVDLDMNRVQSVTVLKDASAKALYGSKAANGVIVIETKKLNSGNMVVSYNASIDIEAPDLSSYNLMNSAEKLEAERLYGMYTQNSSATPNYLTQLTLDQQYNQRLGVVLSGVNTDWLSKPLRNGIGQKHNISIELGENDLQAIANFSYNNVAGVMKGSSRNIFATSVSLSYRF